MLVTLSEIVMLARPVQPAKAAYPMLVTLLGIVYEVSDFPSGYFINSVFSLLNRTPLLPEKQSLSLATLMLVRLLQPAKASLPMLSTLLGIVMLVRPVHS